MGVSTIFLAIIALGIVGHSSCYSVPDDSPILKCIPNSVFSYDHNYCYCNKDGTELTCKRKIYSTLTPELHAAQLQNVTLDCVPNKYFEKVNRACICHASGKYASCIRGKIDSVEDTREKCLPGAIFNDQCNGCICGLDGKATCTKLDCLELYKGPSKNGNLQCVPRSALVFQCNDCDCFADGTGMFCNRMGCGSLSLYHEHILNVTVSCEANKIFDYNCKQCACDKNGNYAMCSGKACPRLFDIQEVKDTVNKCNPGIIFANDCNVCICGDDGKGVCTTFSCDTSYRFKYVDQLNYKRPTA